jgi:hypothetical protein
MGWDFRVHPCSKQEIIEEVSNGVAVECIHKSLQGNELWTLWQRKDGSRYISVFLLASKKGCLGYKEISEESGPHYYKCPLRFLEIAPVVNKKWRDKVYEYHAKRLGNLSLRKQVAIGTIVALDNPENEFRVTCLKPLLGVSLKEHRLYRLIKSRIVSVREDCFWSGDKKIREATSTDHMIWM